MAKLINWIANGNNLYKKGDRFEQNVNIRFDGKMVYFEFKVADGYMRTLKYHFHTIENVAYFSENVVDKCHTLEEVDEAYTRIYGESMFKEENDKNTEHDTNKITLTPDEVDQAIIDYFGSGKNYRISVSNENYIDFHGQPHITFYLTEHIDYDGVKRDYKSALTDGDLKHALNAYINFYNYELIDFKFIIRIEKGSNGKDTLSYQGIELNVVPKKEVGQKLEKKPGKKDVPR